MNDFYLYFNQSNSYILIKNLTYIYTYSDIKEDNLTWHLNMRASNITIEDT